ncbi:MAG: hypothetical protein QY323_05260 [Patescibacteria group bacterium]|nr:MAG: hypothetical protein QY323_05260 [Patescibacteria group bacterium]
MRKLALLLAFSLVAAALHFGAMAGFRAMSELATGHAAHADHAVPIAASCPVGSICPMVSSPLLQMNKTAPLSALIVFIALLAAIRLPSFAVFPLAYAGPPSTRPNNPDALLSVFKRE